MRVRTCVQICVRVQIGVNWTSFWILFFQCSSSADVTPPQTRPDVPCESITSGKKITLFSLLARPRKRWRHCTFPRFFDRLLLTLYYRCVILKLGTDDDDEILTISTKKWISVGIPGSVQWFGKPRITSWYWPFSRTVNLRCGFILRVVCVDDVDFGWCVK